MLLMPQIDRLRAEANEALEGKRLCQRGLLSKDYCLICDCVLMTTRARLEVLLQRWWAQGCQEIEP